MLWMKKIIILILIFGFIMSMLTIGVSATTNNYESESNNTIAKADVTCDDYNNYGRLDSSDVDWWSFTATRTGMANIWLGNIPADCDYEMALYTQDGDLIAESTNMFNDNELIKCRVVAGMNYRIKIMPFSTYATSNSYYLFRIKVYDLKPFKIFTYNCDNIDTTADANVCLSYLYSMGYGGQGFLNNTINPVYDTFSASGIFIISHHGGAGIMYLNNSSLLARAYTNMPNNEKAISSYTYNALSNVYLALFFGCNTGLTSSLYGNLVDEAASKGAYVCIGWKNPTYVDTSNLWLEEFVYQCWSYQNVYYALLDTDSWASYNLSSASYQDMKNRYDGDCLTNTLIL